jgi:hypothetical protein
VHPHTIEYIEVQPLNINAPASCERVSLQYMVSDYHVSGCELNVFRESGKVPCQFSGCQHEQTDMNKSHV